MKKFTIAAILLFVAGAGFAQTGSWSYGTNTATLTPTTANAAIGSTVNPQAKLTLNNTKAVVTNDTLFGLHSTLNNTSSNSTQPVYGLYADNTNFSTKGSLYGAYFKNTQKSSGTAAYKPTYGLYVDNTSSVYNGDLYGLYLNNYRSCYSGSVYGIYSNTTLSTSTGGILYGLYSSVSATGYVTGAYAGYFTGGVVAMMNGLQVVGNSYFNGKIGIGITNPVKQLEVLGEMVITNNSAVDWAMPLWVKVNRDLAKAFVVTNTATNTDVFRINGNGTMAAKKVYAEAFEVVPNAIGIYWFDHVFANDYKLRPLREVEQFIKANSHLPEIPSAAEVNEKGYDMGEMQGKLLMKIEELTLYIIQQQKMIQTLNAKVEKLENQ